MAGSRESSRTTSEPPNSHELSASRPCFQGKSQKISYELGGSDVVRILSRELAMFQIVRCVQLAGFFSNMILANSELTAINRLQVRK